MGGFHFYDGPDKPCCPVSPDVVIDLVRRGRIELPEVEEIDDRGKGEVLLNAFVLVQASWFVIQCVARAANSMQITKIEILTVAYLTIALLSYIAWWDKPRNARQPVRIPQALNPSANSPSGNSSDAKFNVFDWFIMAAGIIFASADEPTLSNSKKVPMFYAGDPEDNKSSGAWFIAWMIGGGVFSAILCITWSYKASTSSLAELVIWRLCSLSGVTFFLLFVALALLYDYWDNLDVGWKVSSSAWYENGIGTLVFLFVVSYIVSRITTIFLAIWELRTPPAGTYETVHWTNYIPHI